MSRGVDRVAYGIGLIAVDHLVIRDEKPSLHSAALDVDPIAQRPKVVVNVPGAGGASAGEH